MRIPAPYHWSISAYQTAIKLSALFNPKARKWVEGRKNWRQRLQALMQTSFQPGQPRCWIHVASLGEFEQGRPLIEALKTRYPDTQILLSFFSPSGFEIRQHYPLVDGVCYLPADTPANARDFVDMVRPDIAIFVKYELWLNFLRELQIQHISCFLVSAVFRPGQYYFTPFGEFARRILQGLDGIFVQEETSRELLLKHGFSKVTLAGDTRIDRVMAIATKAGPMDILSEFSQGHPLLIAGSTWAKDEELLAALCQDGLPADWKLVLAPHEINERHLSRTEKRFPFPVVRFSQADRKPLADYKILLIDNIGKLASLYQYGRMAYIGGGFGRSIHNILEPMAFHLPLMFGPRYQAFTEARAMTAAGAARAVHNASELRQAIQYFQHHHSAAAAIIADYLKRQSGATDLIMQQLQAKMKQLS
jgi:3-deoxy-D-manno-octulosonic-acid transferase